MLGGTTGTLLYHLASDGNGLRRAATRHGMSRYATRPRLEVRTGLLEHARLFSLAVNGAFLLYNLLIAELYVDAGHTRIDPPVEDIAIA